MIRRLPDTRDVDDVISASDAINIVCCLCLTTKSLPRHVRLPRPGGVNHLINNAATVRPCEAANAASYVWVIETLREMNNAQRVIVERCAPPVSSGGQERGALKMQVLKMTDLDISKLAHKTCMASKATVK